ncbi:MAG: hypothetical protein ACYCTI_00225 [Acidimicrobiales bacterium]
MSDIGIFVISDGNLTVVGQAPFESEDVFQKALADHPEVLAAGASTEGGDGRLLLVRREQGIPTTVGGSDVFSVDHLFVDSSGVPVLVEVKRSSDTRLRREVVGQMLDYAANGAMYWTAAELRADFEAQAEATGEKPDLLLEQLAPDVSPDQFWERVDRNLSAGHVRMVFVADRLPDGLVRVIEFLNEQMSPAEVLGVELQHFANGGLRVLVPRIVGATSTAKATKQRSTGVPWTMSTFLSVAQERCPAQVESFESLFKHAEQRGRLNWGKGMSPGVSGWYPVGDAVRGVWTASTASVPNSAYLYIWLPEIRDLLGPERTEKFLAALRLIHAFDLELTAAKRKYPSVDLDLLTEGDLKQFLVAVESLAGIAAVEHTDS